MVSQMNNLELRVNRNDAFIGLLSVRGRNDSSYLSRATRSIMRMRAQIRPDRALIK